MKSVIALVMLQFAGCGHMIPGTLTGGDPFDFAVEHKCQRRRIHRKCRSPASARAACTSNAESEAILIGASFSNHGLLRAGFGLATFDKKRIANRVEVLVERDQRLVDEGEDDASRREGLFVMRFLRSAVRSFALALISCVVVYVGSVQAACKSEACRQALAWKNGYTAIVLEEDVSSAAYFGILDAVQKNNGVVGIETERVLLGWVPKAATGKIRSTEGVRAVLHEAAARPDDLTSRADALATIRF